MIYADNPPSQACSTPNAPPHAINVVRPVGAEKYIEINHKSGTVDIKVFLGPDGTVTKAFVFHSSGDTFLDGATYDAAIATAYAPEIRNCEPIAGAYIYRTKYSAETDGKQAGSSAPAPSRTPAPPQTYPTTIATTVPTTYATTIATTVPTTYATTIATTAPKR